MKREFATHPERRGRTTPWGSAQGRTGGEEGQETEGVGEVCAGAVFVVFVRRKG